MNQISLLSNWVNLAAVRHYIYYQHIYARPRRGFRNNLTATMANPDFKQIAERFDQDGIIVLERYFNGDKLRAMQEDFDRWAESSPLEETLEFGLDRSHLVDSIALSEAAIDPFLTAVTEYYYGKPVCLADNYGYRMEPADLHDYGSNRWHHDARRKSVKVMIYLNDVEAQGQRMDYIPGTHKIWHRNIRTDEDVIFTPEKANKYGEPFKCVGPAGSVVIFDTNGLHRGNRNLSSRRDVWQFVYSAGRHLQPRADLHPEVVARMEDRSKSIARIYKIK